VDVRHGSERTTAFANCVNWTVVLRDTTAMRLLAALGSLALCEHGQAGGRGGAATAAGFFCLAGGATDLSTLLNCAPMSRRTKILLFS